MTYPANLLITNYCNQNCPFCFASREMKNKTLDKEINIEDFKKVLAKLSHSGNKTIKLLGGEPTLHSKLFDLLDLIFKKKLNVQIFTNGVIGKEKIVKLAKYGKKIGYTFNLTTPGFQRNITLRKEIVKNLITLKKESKITLSLTMDPFFNQSQFFVTTSSFISTFDNIRIGLANPIAHTKNWYQFSDFPKMGEILENFIKGAIERGFKGTFLLNCGFTRCMFTSEQFKYLKSQVKFIGWSCFGKTSSMDISVDMKAFHCFPFSDYKQTDLTKISYKEANKKLIKARMTFWAELKKEHCSKCAFYGYGAEKCPGPCLAFQINNQ